ncbi:MAG: hypothetical protein MMC23_004166 [Stictis urceolatum]|nr:hypothetical protein [Stictis urceolata]
MLSKTLFLGAALATLATAAPTTRMAKRTQGQVVTGSAAVTTINDEDGVGAGSNTYNFYQGDGSTGAGWPDQSQWASFNEMFQANTQAMSVSCANNGWGDNDSTDEIQAVHDAIESVALATGVDHRFILATIMQESKGCVRVKTTTSPDGTVTNPGLMQDHDGPHACNDATGTAGVVPCPNDQITGMIQDGAGGTDAGDGLAGLLNQAQGTGVSGSQAFYVAARLYNSGSNPTGDLGAPGATRCYASDMANRLTGWTDFGPASTCAF